MIVAPPGSRGSCSTSATFTLVDDQLMRTVGNTCPRASYAVASTPWRWPAPRETVGGRTSICATAAAPCAITRGARQNPAASNAVVTRRSGRMSERWGKGLKSNSIDRYRLVTPRLRLARPSVKLAPPLRPRAPHVASIATSTLGSFQEVAPHESPRRAQLRNRRSGDVGSDAVDSAGEAAGAGPHLVHTRAHPA